MDKNKIGIVRGLPRYAEARQRRALAAADVQRIIDLGETGDEAAINSIRRRDAVVVDMLHILADRSTLGVHPRASLFWWIEHLVRRSAVIVEVGTGSRVDTSQIKDIPDLISMMAPAVETITRGTIGRKAMMLARENGAMSEGRPKRDNQKNREAARQIHLAPRDKRLTGRAYLDALAKLGWTRTAAYNEFRERDGGEKE